MTSTKRMIMEIMKKTGDEYTYRQLTRMSTNELTRIAEGRKKLLSDIKETK